MCLVDEKMKLAGQKEMAKPEQLGVHHHTCKVCFQFLEPPGVSLEVGLLGQTISHVSIRLNQIHLEHESQNQV